MADKKVTVKVDTDVNLEKVKSLEDNIRRIKKEKLQLKIDADTEKLNETEKRIKSLKTFLDNVNTIAGNTNIKINDRQIQKVEAELESLESEKINIELAIEKSKLDSAKSEIEELDGKEINVDAQMSMQNITQGIQIAKQGLMDLKANMDEVAQAGMQSEQNKAFLTMNLGADKAKKTYQDISNIVASTPGDDNTMRSVLSTAQALGNNLNPDEMRAAAGTMADYMSGSATMGKQALESQQDIMKYLLDGNTAELERGSIVSSQVDKLKEASTFQERQAAMQQVLNDLGYGGIANQDTMLNKQAEWEGMIYNSQDALSSMWLGAEKGAMDYILKLNDATGGILGMGIVAGQMAAGPIVDLTMGLGQMATGIKAIKESSVFTGIASKLTPLKTALFNVGGAAKTAAIEMVGLGKKALIAGFNALKAAGMWVVEKVQLVASTLATYAMAAAQAVLNFVMSINPIVLVVLAIIALIAVLVYLYYNVDSVREAIDNLGQSIVSTAQWIYNGFMSIVNTVSSALGAAWNYITNFVGNMVNSLVNGASNAVNGFMKFISQIPQMVLDEFTRTLNLVGEFISSLPQRVWDMGVAIINALKHALGIGSPGHMFYMVEGEFNRIDTLTKKTRFDTGSIGQDMVDSFNPNLNANSAAGVNGNGGDTIINVYGDVDNDKRIKQIIEAVRHELSWNNTTAGRSV